MLVTADAKDGPQTGRAWNGGNQPLIFATVAGRSAVALCKGTQQQPPPLSLRSCHRF